MDRYSLVFVFGKKETPKDQVLLVKKAVGFYQGKWNGLGAKLTFPDKSPLQIISQLDLLSKGDCTIKKVAVLAYPHRLVYCYGVYIEHDLQTLVSRLDVVNEYWITHPYPVVKRAFRGTGDYMPDLAQLIPLAMDPFLQTAIISKELTVEQFQKLLPTLNTL